MAKNNNSEALMLKGIDIYEGISDEEIVCIAKNSHDKKVSKKSLIYSPYEDNTNIYVLKKGEVHLYHYTNEKRVVFDILTPGAVFGCFDPKEKRHTHFAECTRDAFLCVTPVREFLLIVEKKPEMMLRFMQKMATRLKEYELKLEVSTGTAADKIIYEISRLKDKRSRNFFGKFFDIPLRVTHEELSLLTGLNRVTITRTLKQLKKEKRLKVDEKTGGIQVLSGV
ncbi:Crp/Fnr family transcriptional regulator [Candidatus Peregrinibacteria bacterium]|jgi:CRP/FNR family transcriptional regulator, cyclic AMP receptor protein|nr:Crp/Fnr family transcriptional regulator [Candidatus Peregrinibacteria bacterium]